MHKELKTVLSDHNKFIIPYSTAHIGDLYSGYMQNSLNRKYIDDDLEFLSEFTSNACLFLNSNNLDYSEISPKIFFDERIEAETCFQDFTLENLEKEFGDNDLSKMMFSSIRSIMRSIPIPNINQLDDYVKCILPDIESNPTFEGIFNSVFKLNDILNESDTYKKLRQAVQNGTNIKRDSIYNHNNPYKIIEGAYSKINQDNAMFSRYADKIPKWYSDIMNNYLFLDMHGYQEDKIEIKEGKRKQTFKNTTEDSFHAAFASTCNFFIVDDNRAYNKVKQVYQKLAINTLVCKPIEFVNLNKKFLEIPAPIDNLKLLSKAIDNNNYKKWQERNKLFRLYEIEHFLFDYFNKILIMKDTVGQDDAFLLSRIPPTNGRIVFFKDINSIIMQIDEMIYGKSGLTENLNPSEVIDGNWSGRHWEFDSHCISLIMLNGYLQLYFN